MGEGTDRIAASSSFALNQEQHVEIIEAINSSDTTAINLTGSSFANRIVGNAGPNVLNGAAGADVLIGLDGDDDLNGGSVQTGVDVLIGGLGNDTYRGGIGTVIIEAAGEGTDRFIAASNYTMPADVELEILEANGSAGDISLTGNALSQTLIGSGGNNTLNGGGGEDDMTGGGGSDRFIVDSAGDVVHEAVNGGANDRISSTISYTLAPGIEVEIIEAVTSSGTDPLNFTGNEFGNSLIGTNGVNTLDAGAGLDMMTGLGGADTFRFTTALAASNSDRIMDFVSGSDRLALDDAVFTGLAPGALPAGAFVIGTAAGDADDRIVYNSTTGQLYFDADGNGAGAMVQFAILQLHPALLASDFIII